MKFISFDPVINFFLRKLHPAVVIIFICFLLPIIFSIFGWLPQEFCHLSFVYLSLGLGFCLSSLELFLHNLFNEHSNSVEKNIISIRLMWKHSFQFIGFYEASILKKEIDLREGGTPIGLDPVACVIEGIDTFGVTTVVELIRRYYEDAIFRKAEIVPCYVVFRKSPVVLISNDHKSLSLDGLNGKRVAFYGRSDSTYREFSILCKDANIEVKFIFLEDMESMENPLSSLIKQIADVRVGYIFNEGIAAMQQKYAVKPITEVFGKNLYSDVVCVKMSKLQENLKEYLPILGCFAKGFLSCGNPTGVRNIIDKTKYLETLKNSIQGKTQAQEVKNLCEHLKKCVEPDNRPTSSYLLIGRLQDWLEIEKLVTSPDMDSYTSMLQHKQLFTNLSFNM